MFIPEKILQDNLNAPRPKTYSEIAEEKRKENVKQGRTQMAAFIAGTTDAVPYLPTYSTSETGLLSRVSHVAYRRLALVVEIRNHPNPTTEELIEALRPKCGADSNFENKVKSDLRILSSHTCIELGEDRRWYFTGEPINFGPVSPLFGTLFGF